mgnify:CR=1 FL=1
MYKFVVGSLGSVMGIFRRQSTLLIAPTFFIAMQTSNSANKAKLHG